MSELTNLPAKHLEAVIDELYEVGLQARRGDPVRVSRVTLHLRTGKDVHGVVVDKTRAAGGTWVLVQNVEPKGPGEDLTYVALTSIEAATVHEALKSSLPPPEKTKRPAPSKLELRRQLAGLQEKLTHLLGRALTIDAAWDTLPTAADDDARRMLGELADDTAQVLEELGRDKLGQDALRDKVDSVQLALGNQARVSLDQRRLTLTTTAAWAARLTRITLKAELERSL